MEDEGATWDKWSGWVGASAQARDKSSVRPRVHVYEVAPHPQQQPGTLHRDEVVAPYFDVVQRHDNPPPLNGHYIQGSFPEVNWNEHVEQNPTGKNLRGLEDMDPDVRAEIEPHLLASKRMLARHGDWNYETLGDVNRESSVSGEQFGPVEGPGQGALF